MQTENQASHFYALRKPVYVGCSCMPLNVLFNKNDLLCKEQKTEQPAIPVPWSVNSLENI